MAKAKQGDTVKVHYEGRLKDGKVFDSSADRDPLEFTVGAEQVIPGFEQGVIGMKPGESKTVEVPADDAYGPHHDKLVLVVPREHVPEHIKPQAGQPMQLTHEDGRKIMVMVTKVSEESITLDGNHPLAGQDLVFDIKLVEIA